MRQTLCAFFILTVVAGCASHPATHVSPVPLVYIHGTVVPTHGAYPWREGITVLELIKAVGGLSIYGDNANIRVTHLDGTQDRYKYPLIVSGQTRDPVLQPGDKVYVSGQLF